MGRLLIAAGVVLILLGIAINFGGGFFSKIPGNFEWRGKNWAVYFPFGACVLLSIVGSLLLWLFSRR